MAQLAIGGFFRPQLVGDLAQAPQGIAILPRLAEQIKPAVSFGWNHARTVMKQEGVALTLLFFCALNLVPVWIAATLAVCGIARIVWALSKAQSELILAEEAARNAGQLQVENEDLQLERDRAVRSRDEAENARDQVANEKGVLQVQHDLVRGQLADAQGALQAVNQRREMEVRVHQLQLQERDAENGLHGIAVRDRDLVEQQRDVLKQGVDRRDRDITRLERERDDAVQAMNWARQEKLQLQEQLAAAQVIRAPDDLQVRWQRIEQQRNEVLARISQAYDQAVRNRDEDALSGLEMEAGQIIPDLVAQKQEAAGYLDEAIARLPQDHEARPRLVKLKGLYQMEEESLGNIARVFALPVFIRRLMFQPAQPLQEV